MSLWKIAWRSIQHRTLASTLTAISMALGVALVVAVLVIHSVLDQSFKKGAQGYDVIVGPKGSPLDLVLSTVFYLDAPSGTIPESYFDDLAYRRYANLVEKREGTPMAFPICLGGNYKGYPVVGVTSDMFDKLEYARDKRYTFREGSNFKIGQTYTGVVGSTVARETGLKVGDTFRPMHGIDPNQGEQHDPFKIVGVLDHTGTPNDRALFINIEGFWAMHEHDDHEHGDHEGETAEDHDHEAEPAAAAADTDHEAEAAETSEDADHEHEGEPTAAAEPADESWHPGHSHGDERQVSAILVCTNPDIPTQTADLQNLFNKDRVDAQVVYPSEEIGNLFDKLIGNIQLVLIILAVLVVIVAGIGMMVSIYNSMSERRHEIAVMRALGARRGTVMAIILCESILLSLGGGAIGVILGHLLIAVLGGPISEATGLIVHPLSFKWVELILIPGLVTLASIVGFLPAVVAYRTDVAESLGE